MVTPRILRAVEREIPEMGGGRVAVSFLFLLTKMTSTVLLRLRVKLLSFDHDSMWPDAFPVTHNDSYILCRN